MTDDLKDPRRVTRAEVFAVTARDRAGRDPLDPSTHTLVARLTDGAGRSGVGEADAPPAAARAFLEMEEAFDWSGRVTDLVIGADPLEAPALYDRFYEATIYPGRRGLGIHALSAVDVALYDLAGKQLGVPAYKLLGGARRPRLTPYATVYVGTGGGVGVRARRDALESKLARAVALGFRAVKAETLFPEVGDRELIAILRQARAAVGDDITLMADFGYRFSDWRAAARVLNRVEDCDLFFAEATLQHDDLDGHARLAGAVGTRVAGAEFAATRHECREWIERGRVDVLQPDVSRCGGLSEIRRIAEMAQLYGVLVIPHAWKTGITAAAGRHFQAATANAPFFEYLSPELWDSELRARLVGPEPLPRDGAFDLPRAPGLGVSLRPEYEPDGAEADGRRDDPPGHAPERNGRHAPARESAPVVAGGGA
jgi:L-rhamnonate dehydratase